MLAEIDRHRVASHILSTCVDELTSLKGKIDRQRAFFDPSLHSDVLKELDAIGELLSQADCRLFNMLLDVEKKIWQEHTTAP
jgi:hypothetical protein